MPCPQDFQYRWTIADIGLLNEVSFEHPTLNISADELTVTCWIYPTHLNRIQVMVNCGNRSITQSGWTLLIKDGHLVAQANFGGGRSMGTTVFLANPNCWHHVAVVIDWENQLIRGYLNGVSDNWQACEQAVEFAAENLAAKNLLVIGGYTDAAGGHFDYTFGRQGTGYVDDVRIYSRPLSPPEINTFIKPDNQSPQASFQIQPTNPKAPARLQFDATASHDSDGRIITYLWDFGDGQTDSGQTVTHTYDYAGSYTVHLTVIDNDHGQNTAVQTITLTGQENPLKTAPVFINGTEGYACYRIPAIVRAINGDLVAFAEGRVADCSDSTPVIRLVCKRSSDNGATWSPVQVVARNVIHDAEYACMNPSPVVDTVHGTGRIIVVFNKHEVSEWEIAAGKGVSRVCCVMSDDNGRSWVNESDITSQVHKPYNPDFAYVHPDAARSENNEADWRKHTPTLGHAIQLQGTEETRGRLFYVGSRTIGTESIFDAQNYAFWSDDLGQCWQIGDAVKIRDDGSSAKGLNEATAVELEDGSVMINSRNYQQQKVAGHRAITIGTFNKDSNIHFKPVYHDTFLVDSGVQASIIRYSYSWDGQLGHKNRILFANPDHPQARINMTVRLSYNEGQSWPISKVIDSGPAAYSDLVIQSDNHIGLLYEQGNQGGIAYVNFSLAWLTDGSDMLVKHENRTL